MKKEIEEYKIFFEKLKRDKTYSRLGKTFETENTKYFYDLGIGKVLEKENDFEAIDQLNCSCNGGL